MTNANHFLSLIDEKALHVGVIGLGYVGLPLLLAFANKGFEVTGIDIDEEKVSSLRQGTSYLKHIPSSEISSAKEGSKVHFSSDFSTLTEVDAILICVPTPLNRYREPDMKYVVDTVSAIAPYLRSGHLVVLESTTYPGTTEEIIGAALKQTGLARGENVFLAYSPEREDPGNLNFHTTDIPKVVGANDESSLEVATRLYDCIVPSTVQVSSIEAAEATKLTENIFRSVNIALVNELKIIYSRMGINVWEVIEAAATKPFGFMPFYPGPGLGGHCIPIDPFYLTWKAREFETPTKFIELAGEINSSMPNYVVETLGRALGERQQKSVFKSKILILGLAYKPNIDDIRESPALKILEILSQRGADLSFYDPYVSKIGKTREYSQFAGMERIDWQADILRSFDAAIICTDHDAVDYVDLVRCVPLVIDTRNVIARTGGDMTNVVRS